MSTKTSIVLFVVVFYTSFVRSTPRFKRIAENVPLLNTSSLINRGSDALNKFPLIDGHNDLAYQILDSVKNNLTTFRFENDLTKDLALQKLHTDIPRLRAGKVGAQFWVAYVSCNAQYKDSVSATLEQIDVIKRLIRKYPNDLQFVASSEDIMNAFQNKKIGSLIGVEGGHSIDSRLSVLRMYYDLGVRYLTLTHVCNTPWADSATVDQEKLLNRTGLSHFGQVVIREMNRLGMLVDLSHTSKLTMDMALRISVAPVIFSHSSVYSVFPHPRNVQDDTLLLLKMNGGVIMINFFPDFISSGSANISTVVEHINYVANFIGTDYVGIGSDYDGIPRLDSNYPFLDGVPSGLEDVSKYPDLFDAVHESNRTLWTEENLEKLAGRNLLRVLQQVESIRDELIYISPAQDLISSEEFEGIENAEECRTEPETLNAIFKNIAPSQ